MIRGVRGAVTIECDDAQFVLQETAHLMQEIIAANHINPENVASVIVSTTPDITSAFPAKAVRTLTNWNYVPVMCMHEMNVPEALPLCIRILVHVNTEVKQEAIQHIYLNDAVKLRPDLAK